MAGPTASVLLAQSLTDEQRLSVWGVIAELSDHVESNDFWVQTRPFIMTCGPEYPEELEEHIAAGLPDLIGWTPKDTIGLIAMCNQQVDHRLLGQICVRIARLLDGVVDFGGELDFSASVRHVGLFSACNVEEAKYHVGNVEFLDWWLVQPDFRMIK